MFKTIELIIALVLVGVITLQCTSALKKYRKTFYISVLVASLVSLALMSYINLSPYNVPEFIHTVWYLLPYRLIARGYLGAALWSFVMVASSVPNKKLRDRIMSVRTELSIMGTLISLPQAIVYSISFTPKMFNGSIPYAIGGVLLFIIVVLLFVLGWTSLEKPKKRLGMGKWKKIQRWAYLFYFILFLELIIISVMRAMYEPFGTLDFYGSWLRVAIYCVIYFGYLALKINRKRQRARNA